MSNSEIRNLFMQCLDANEVITLHFISAHAVDAVCRKFHGVRNKDALQGSLSIVRDSKELIVEIAPIFDGATSRTRVAAPHS